MPPGVKSLAALVAAVAMVGGAVVARNALDTKKVRDDLRLTVVCDPLAFAFCEAAKAADPRLMIREESPEKTTKALQDLPQGQAPDFQAWVSVGPWLQMADGRRMGQGLPRLQKAVSAVASTPIVLVTRMNQDLLAGCSKQIPAACLPLPQLSVGLPSPRSNGVGLAGLAQVIIADTGIQPGDLDRNTFESGAAVPVIERLRRRTNPGAGREQVNAQFSGANPIVTTQASSRDFPGAKVVTSGPAVRAVLQVGALDERAIGPLGAEPAGQALQKAATDAGWDRGGDLAGGLPEPGVLAALQDAWRGP